MFTIIKETITYIITVLGFIIGAVSLYITLRDKKVQEETSDEQKKLLDRLNHSFDEFRTPIEGLPVESKNSLVYSYKSTELKFTGREIERTALKDFCVSRENVLWWELIGPGGMGKSRLLYETAKDCKKRNWDVFYLKESSYLNGELFYFLHPNRQKKNTLVIADPADGHECELLKMVEAVSDISRGKKLRIILVRKNQYGKNIIDSLDDWSIHYTIDKRKLLDTLYKIEPFYLIPLDTSSLKKIIIQYAQVVFKKKIDDRDVNRLIQWLEKHDKKELRPSLAICLVMAWNDGVNISEWKNNNALDFIIEKEIHSLSMKVAPYSKGKNNIALIKELLNVFFIATIFREVDLKNVAIQTSISIIAENIQGIPLRDFLIEIGVNTIDGKNEKIYSPFEPEYLGEYYVYWFIRRYGYKNLFCEGWQKDGHTSYFLSSFVNDFQTIAISDFANSILEKPCENPDSGYCVLMTNIIALCADSSLSTQALSNLKLIYEKDFSEEHALSYGLGLSIWGIGKKSQEKENIKNKLKALRNKHNSPLMLRLYSLFLLHLLLDTQRPEEGKVIISEIKDLCDRNPHIEEIKSIYMNGLCHQASLEKLEDAEKILDELKKIYDADNADLYSVRWYSTCLVIVLGKSNNDCREKYYQALSDLYERNSSNIYVIESYVHGQAIMILDYDKEKCEFLLSNIEVLQETYPNNDQILYAYATGLARYYTKEFADIEMGNSLLKNLHEKYILNDSITIIYAEFLLKYCKEAPTNQRYQIVDYIKDLGNNMVSKKGTTIQYAKGLVLLIKDQSFEEAQRIVQTLKTVYENDRVSDEIAIEYANGVIQFINRLIALKYKSDNKLFSDQIKTLRNLSENFPANNKLLVLYSDGLVFLTFIEEGTSLDNTVTVLEKLHMQSQNNEKILENYAVGLKNSAYTLDDDHLEITLEKLRNLHTNYSHNVNVAEIYAAFLFFLESKQDIEEKKKTVDSICELHTKYRKSSNILLRYGEALGLLAQVQSDTEAKATINKLHKLQTSNSDNEDLAFIYLMSICDYIINEYSEIEETIEYVNTAETLFNQFDTERMAFAYSKVLFWIVLSDSRFDLIKQRHNAKEYSRIKSEIQKSREKLIQLSFWYPSNREIAYFVSRI